MRKRPVLSICCKPLATGEGPRHRRHDSSAGLFYASALTGIRGAPRKRSASALARARSSRATQAATRDACCVSHALISRLRRKAGAVCARRETAAAAKSGDLQLFSRIRAMRHRAELRIEVQDWCSAYHIYSHACNVPGAS